MGGEIGGGGDDFVGGVADFADNHQIFHLCADADADVELVFHRVKFGVVAAPIDIMFGIVSAFFQQVGEYAAIIVPLRYDDADDAAYLVFFFGGRKQVFAVGKELLGAQQEGCAKLGQVDIACVAGKSCSPRCCSNSAITRVTTYGETDRRSAVLRNCRVSVVKQKYFRALSLSMFRIITARLPEKYNMLF